MEITILLENSKPKSSNLSIEHGLSMSIKKEDQNFLFDTGGPKESAIKNAAELGINISKIDAVIISHGHNDHTGGLLKFLQINDKAPIYLKKEVLSSYYSKRPDGMKFIGTDSQLAEKHRDRFNFVNETVEIANGVFLLPEISNDFPIPSSNRVLFTEKDENLINDNFEHELFMGIVNKGNMVIFSGCGHNGIKNIINTAKDAIPDKKIAAVIGGFHFQAGSSDYALVDEEEIKEIAEWLKSEVSGKIYTGHCTGERGINIMKPILKERLEKIYTGRKISL